LQLPEVAIAGKFDSIDHRWDHPVDRRHAMTSFNNPNGDGQSTDHDALDRARSKAYWRLLPILFACYVIAYVDRANVSIAKLTMTKDLGFDNAVIGFAAGIFFVGYFLLEIPGSILCERWSARKWISRIMITWGMVAAATALVKTPFQFYGARFVLGLAEAGFFPGAIVFLTHWFPKRDRAKALAIFMVATPSAQLLSPKISNVLLKIGTSEVIDGVTVVHPQLLGMVGWQWVYIAWGIPAVVLGIMVLFLLPDHPRHARWLTDQERNALESELAQELAHTAARRRMTLAEAFYNPKVLTLTAAYFCTVTASYGLEFFLPSILQRWYSLKIDSLTTLILLPPVLALSGQLFVGWNSDRTKERRLHASLPGIIGGVALALSPLTRGNLPLSLLCFVLAGAGVKAYLPAFWAMPSMFLTATAAAGSIGLINSVGNLGGMLGPSAVGSVEKYTGSFVVGIYFLACAMFASSTIILLMQMPERDEAPSAPQPVIQESQKST
jgi:ACS family tartrate transporter-like MFS transporter